MQPELMTKLKKAMYRKIIRERQKATFDPVGLTESLAEDIEFALDLMTASEGIAAVPRALREEDETPWDYHENRPAPPRISPAPPASKAVSDVPPEREGLNPTPSIIAVPGSKEYQEADPSAKQRSKPGVVSAVDIRRKTAGRTDGKTASRKEWDEATLIQTVLDNTPEEIPFEPLGLEGKVTLKAIRNVRNMPGIGCSLTYRHSSVDESRDGFLIAKWAFSLYDRELDFDKALFGPTDAGTPMCIKEQLRHQYKPREKSMQAHTMAPAPPEHTLGYSGEGDTPMGDSFRSDLRPGMAARPSEKIQEEVFQQIKHSNDQLAPQGFRFDR